MTRREGGGLDQRLAALAEAAELARGRLDDSPVDAAEAVVARAGRRLGLGMETTVVALAGPTGAGKSTLFNALAGEELATAGHRRPTTSAASAAVWGEVGDALLDWLEVPRRHRRGDAAAGMVLLDLPDFDSVERSHREEVERVLALADLVIWVVDPQKYADAVLHEGYLRPLAAYERTMMVVFNQADRLDAAARAACHADLQRLLAADGLPGLPVLAVSATTGEGLGALREELDRRADAREAATARLDADVRSAAADLAPSGGGAAGRIGRAERAALGEALAHAAGVPAVLDAVTAAHRRRGALATGWPFVRWLRRLRPDPLRRLRLGEGDAAERSSMPAPTGVQRAQVETAARALADRASRDLPAPWPGLARRAALAREEELAERLDAAVASADLGMRTPRWWAAAGALQLALAAVVVLGALWLAVLAGLGYLQLDDAIPTPDASGFPVPTLLLAGGALAGLLLAALAGILVRIGARRRARVAGRALRARVDTVGEQDVVAPVLAELEAQQRLAAALEAAGATRSPKRQLVASR